MNRLAHGSAALIAGLLTACGGGGYGSPAPAPAPPPPPPPPSGTALTTANYQNALKLSFGAALSAFSNARIGVVQVASLDVIPPSLGPTPCPISGSISSLFTDQNLNGLLDKNDSVLMQWDDCNSGQLTLDGLMRVDVNDLVALADGREITLTVTTAGFRVNASTPGALPITLNFVLPIRYTRTTTSDRYVLAAATYRSGASIGEDALEMLTVDLLQDYATNTYRYSLSGSVDSEYLDGKFDFETTVPFSGVLGEYPSAGRLVATGSGNTSARLSEEGSALTNPDTILAAVDTNGDGVDDAVVPELEWSTVFPLVMFTSFRDQVVIAP
jgi:hypothetical protein